MTCPGSTTPLAKCQLEQAPAPPPRPCKSGDKIVDEWIYKEDVIVEYFVLRHHGSGQCYIDLNSSQTSATVDLLSSAYSITGGKTVCSIANVVISIFSLGIFRGDPYPALNTWCSCKSSAENILLKLYPVSLADLV